MAFIQNQLNYLRIMTLRRLIGYPRSGQPSARAAVGKRGSRYAPSRSTRSFPYPVSDLGRTTHRNPTWQVEVSRGCG